MQWLIRPAHQGDDDLQIFNLHSEAFGGPDEAKLVEKLQLSDCFIPDLSLVATTNSEIVGHLLLTSIQIITDRGDSLPSLALAPMAVLPAYQQKGLGSALVRTALAEARVLGYNSIIVLGHAQYYPRFGFKPASQWLIRSPFSAPDEVFMAMELIDDSLKDAAGLVRYSAPFYEVE